MKTEHEKPFLLNHWGGEEREKNEKTPSNLGDGAGRRMGKERVHLLRRADQMHGEKIKKRVVSPQGEKASGIGESPSETNIERRPGDGGKVKRSETIDQLKHEAGKGKRGMTTINRKKTLSIPGRAN